MKGRVVSYKEAQGYGFIQDEEDRRRFFRASDVVSGSPAWGAEAEFVPMRDERGLAACQIRFTVLRESRVVSFGDLQMPLATIVAVSLAWEQVPDSKGAGYKDSPVLWLRTTDGKRHLFSQTAAEFDVEEKFKEISQLLESRK